MSAVCTCVDPVVVRSASAIAPHCRRCGSWWNPQHGSRPEGDAGVNRVVMKYERLSLADARGEKMGRNDLCVCGSGVKFKKCCGGARKV